MQCNLRITHNTIGLCILSGSYDNRGDGSIRVSVNYHTEEIIITAQSNPQIITTLDEYTNFEGDISKFVVHKIKEVKHETP